ncbi:MAG: DinB family protein [Chloroflexi bacterium]|nr:DinB family protein [Chloroflexota bacterium]
MGAFTYPRSEPGSSGHMDLVEALNSTPPALQRELNGLSEAALTYRTANDEWSIKEVCGHLRDDAQFLHRRLFAMINLEEPRLEAWDPEALMRERNPQATPIDELLAEFTAQRRETVEMLADLVHWNWARQGRHAERGRVSIRQMVEGAVRHEESHLEQIRSLKEQAQNASALPTS